jgi:hypothetical protein
METIELKLDEDNELAFSVVIEGTRGEPAKIRFVIEDNDMSIAFPGHSTSSGEVKIDVPSLKKMMSEGTYKGKLEVIAEERFFEPLKFNVDLKQSLKIEAAIMTKDKSTRSGGVTISAKPIVKNTSKNVIVEKTDSPKPRHPTKTKVTKNKNINISESMSKIAEKYDITESQVREYIKDILKKS